MADYVERKAAIAAIKKDIMGGLNYESILKRIPASDVQPVKHGRWGGKFPVSRCSICDATMILGDYGNYCPNCGAKMDGEDNG